LRQRLWRSAKVQEGDKPPEDPTELRQELERVSEELTKLIKCINKTNSTSEIEPGVTFSDALAVRDILKLKHGIYRDLAQAAVVTQDRYSRSEVRFKSMVNIAEIQKEADRLAKEHRELDAKIQEANWRTELVE
jgi:hypothetical protein